MTSCDRYTITPVVWRVFLGKCPKIAEKVKKFQLKTPQILCSLAKADPIAIPLKLCGKIFLEDWF